MPGFDGTIERVSPCWSAATWNADGSEKGNGTETTPHDATHWGMRAIAARAEP